MKSVKKLGVFALFLCLFLTACKEDPVIVDPPQDFPAYEVPVKEVISSLSGVVLNEAGEALAEATVEVGNTSVLTDENGVFFIPGLKMNAYGTLVKVGKPGYFLGAQMVNAVAGVRSDTRFVLMAREIVGTIAAAAGGTVTANENSKITLPANGIVTASGDTYSGEVSVAARWIDPTRDDLAFVMPGDLRAIDATQEAVQLATYGMLAVELEGAAGEALNLAEGSTASLEFPVPEDLRADAPNTIPLWHFDEATGFWVEEGEAVFDGEKYVGSVGHFSFWNCDAPFPLVEMSGSVVDLDGNPVEGAIVSISVNSSAAVAGGRTDEQGVFSGKIPQDEALTVRIHLHPVCVEVIYTGMIGPFSDDVTLPPIVIDPNSSTTVKYLDVVGQMENCDGDVITEGYVKVDFGGIEGSLFLWPDDNTGEIMTNIVYCNAANTFEAVAYDLEGEKQSDFLTYNIPSNGEVDLGTISVCEALVEQLNYSINSDDFIIVDPGATLDAGLLNIFGFGPDSAIVNIQVMVAGPGVYQPDYAEFAGMANNNFPYAFCQGAASGCVDFDITITSIGAVGELVEGTFDGVVEDINPGNTNMVSGTFKTILE